MARICHEGAPWAAIVRKQSNLYRDVTTAATKAEFLFTTMAYIRTECLSNITEKVCKYAEN